MKPGATIEGTAFYVELYDSIGESKELKRFGCRLKRGYEAMKQKYQSIEKMDVSRFRELAAFMKTDLEKQAVQRIVSFLKEKYGGSKTVIFEHYTKEELKCRPKSAIKFVNLLLKDIHWQHYFLYQDEKKHEELKMGTYEKKVNALDRLRSCREDVSESNISNEELYQLMKYYLPLKMIRNRINHASEEVAEEDEKKALERLERDHGVCAGREFGNVKNMMYAGLQMVLKLSEG